MIAMKPEDALAFNPEPRIEQVRFSSGLSCFVVDDALLDPEQLVRFDGKQWVPFGEIVGK